MSPRALYIARCESHILVSLSIRPRSRETEKDQIARCRTTGSPPSSRAFSETELHLSVRASRGGAITNQLPGAPPFRIVRHPGRRGGGGDLFSLFSVPGLSLCDGPLRPSHWRMFEILPS